MHTIILLAANHWVRVCRKPAIMAFCLAHHKVEAIRIINERLENPEIACADGTIGAVAAISLAEVRALSIPFLADSKDLNGQQWVTGGCYSSLEWLRASH